MNAAWQALRSAWEGLTRPTVGRDEVKAARAALDSGAGVWAITLLPDESRSLRRDRPTSFDLPGRRSVTPTRFIALATRRAVFAVANCPRWSQGRTGPVWHLTDIEYPREPFPVPPYRRLAPVWPWWVWLPSGRERW